MPRKNEVSITLPRSLIDRIAAMRPDVSPTTFIRLWTEFGLAVEGNNDLATALETLLP